MQICTLCLCRHGHDPNLMTNLCTFTTPPLPPGTPPVPPLNANTHAGVLPASALSNSMHSQNANVDNLVNGCFVMLPEIVSFGGGEILREYGLADQTNSAPLFPRGLSMTSLLVEANSTADSTVSEGTNGGSIFPTLSLLT
jgi:hypothetical protein